MEHTPEKRLSRLTPKSRMEVEIEAHVYEWAVCYPDLEPREFLATIKRYDPEMIKTIIRICPVTSWLEKREQVLNLTTSSMVKRHIDYIAEMNDVHMKAGKLIIAKAVEMMSRLKVEEHVDAEGRRSFRGFRPSDLNRLSQAIAVAQSIQRKALGLPNDEGSVTVWNQVTTSVASQTGDATSGGDTTEKTVMETVTLEQQVQSLSSRFSYDDVRGLIAAMKERKALQEPKNVTPGADG